MGCKKTHNKHNKHKAGAWLVNVQIQDDQGSQRQFGVDLRLGLVLRWFQDELVPLVCGGNDGRNVRIVASGASGSGNTSSIPCGVEFPHGIFIKVIHNNGGPFSGIQTDELNSLGILQRAGLIGQAVPNLASIGGWLVDNSPGTIALTGSMVNEDLRVAIEGSPVVNDRLRSIYHQAGGPFAIIVSERLNVVWDEGIHQYLELESGIQADFHNIAHVLAFLRESAIGLRVLHENGVVHNDIKPDNIGGVAVDGTLTFKITDMGLVSEGGCVTAGTHGFIDIWNNDEALPEGGKKDIYSLGKTILEVIGLHGLLDTIDGPMPIDVVRDHVLGGIRSLQWFPQEYVASLTHLISFMLAPDRHTRISAEQVIQFIRRIDEGNGTVEGIH
jgi:hypothetical protein